MENRGPAVSRFGIDQQEIATSGSVYWNLPPAALYEEALKRGEAQLAAAGPLVARTGEHTGRSANDKFVVQEPGSEDVWWGKVNAPIERSAFDALRGVVQERFSDRDLFVFDGYAGADPR